MFFDSHLAAAPKHGVFWGSTALAQCLGRDGSRKSTSAWPSLLAAATRRAAASLRYDSVRTQGYRTLSGGEGLLTSVLRAERAGISRDSPATPALNSALPNLFLSINVTLLNAPSRHHRYVITPLARPRERFLRVLDPAPTELTAASCETAQVSATCAPPRRARAALAARRRGARRRAAAPPPAARPHHTTHARTRTRPSSITIYNESRDRAGQQSATTTTPVTDRTIDIVDQQDYPRAAATRDGPRPRAAAPPAPRHRRSDAHQGRRPRRAPSWARSRSSSTPAADAQGARLRSPTRSRS